MSKEEILDYIEQMHQCNDGDVLVFIGSDLEGII